MLMPKALIPALLVALLAPAAFPVSAADTPTMPAAASPLLEQQVDALFAKWNKPDMPGCAVEVIRDGKVILRKAYGMADLERGVPIQPSTQFPIGSMTKQFTAFAIHLLARDGKLKLDDDIRIHVPELPDFGQVITIRNLLQHTSGLRDVTNLLLLAGWRMEDVMTEDDLAQVLKRQRALNFAPGQEAAYSNTNYQVLTMIVERLSSKSLAAFAQERIFEPLGMRHTAFPSQRGTQMPGRARSYVREGGAYREMAAPWSVTGAGGLSTTLEDLAIWDRNFYDARIGDQALLDQMQAPGVLTGGKSIVYAAGLMIETYRGLRVVEHSGGIAAYRAQLTRFPDQRFSVAVLTNTQEINPSTMTRRIADLYLDTALAPKPAPAAIATTVRAGDITAHATAVDPAQLDALIGYYALAPDIGLTVSKESGQLTMQVIGQDKTVLQAVGERTFAFEGEGRLVFDPPGGDGRSGRLLVRQGGGEFPAIRGANPGLPGHGWKDFEGVFYSDELRVLYRVALEGDKLVLTHPRGSVALRWVGNGSFASGFPVGDLNYRCTPAGCSGFTVNSERIRGLQFAKVAIVGVGARATTPTGIFLQPATPSTAAASAPSANRTSRSAGAAR